MDELSSLGFVSSVFKELAGSNRQVTPYSHPMPNFRRPALEPELDDPFESERYALLDRRLVLSEREINALNGDIVELSAFRSPMEIPCDISDNDFALWAMSLSIRSPFNCRTLLLADQDGGLYIPRHGIYSSGLRTPLRRILSDYDPSKQTASSELEQMADSHTYRSHVLVGTLSMVIKHVLDVQDWTCDDALWKAVPPFEKVGKVYRVNPVLLRKSITDVLYPQNSPA